MKPDTPQEAAYLERAGIWEGLIGWCEEMEGEDKEHRQDACAAGEAKEHRLKTCATNQKLKTKNYKLLLKGMTRAVARDLGLI